MAALIDSTMKNAADGPIFCGAAISEQIGLLMPPVLFHFFFILSLVHEYFVLTAAHCFNVIRDISVIGVLVGDHDISQGGDTPYPALYQVQGIIKHPNYVSTSDNQNNDIAMVRTWDQIRWKRTIGPACLPFIYNGVGPTFENYFNGYDLTGNFVSYLILRYC